MSEYIVILRNTPEVQELLGNYSNTKQLYSDQMRLVYLWTQSTNEDADHLLDLQERRMMLGFVLLPAKETL